MSQQVHLSSLLKGMSVRHTAGVVQGAFVKAFFESHGSATYSQHLTSAKAVSHAGLAVLLHISSAQAAVCRVHLSRPVWRSWQCYIQSASDCCNCTVPCRTASLHEQRLSRCGAGCRKASEAATGLATLPAPANVGGFPTGEHRQVGDGLCIYAAYRFMRV